MLAPPYQHVESQVHDHKGEVRFEELPGEDGTGKRVKISWLLSVRPWFGFGRKRFGSGVGNRGLNSRLIVLLTSSIYHITLHNQQRGSS